MPALFLIWAFLIQVLRLELMYDPFSLWHVLFGLNESIRTGVWHLKYRDKSSEHTFIYSMLLYLESDT